LQPVESRASATVAFRPVSLSWSEQAASADTRRIGSRKRSGRRLVICRDGTPRICPEVVSNECRTLLDGVPPADDERFIGTDATYVERDVKLARSEMGSDRRYRLFTYMVNILNESAAEKELAESPAACPTPIAVLGTGS
jgi:hypothetical protein